MNAAATSCDSTLLPSFLRSIASRSVSSISISCGERGAVRQPGQRIDGAQADEFVLRYFPRRDVLQYLQEADDTVVGIITPSAQNLAPFLRKCQR
ncbi:hypothetical protein [Janthinobacterium sp.]|uniref:hypothetical protein n=1 Tax=Janthinobacterium sp. TaxID=1871054 RepID=UPI00289F7C0D|nr:hypothetical protein [Janthinobacterium sp.]